MDKYQKKRLKIGLVYLLIFVIIIGGIYLIIKSGAPSCSDGIQNQGEAGIDCGGPCSPCPWQVQKDLKVNLAKAIETTDDYLDLMAEIENPNSEFGAKKINYVFKLYNAQDKLIQSYEQSSYILPRETKYLVKKKISVSEVVDYVRLEILSVEWKELVEYDKPELIIQNSSVSQQQDLVLATGTLENRSNYDFYEIDLWAVLFDKNSNIIGVNKMGLDTVLSGEKRYFELNWHFPIKEKIDKLDIKSGTNVFLDENFMKRYGGEKEKFQEY